MIVTIKNDDGEFLFDINKIEDEAKKQEAGVIVQKVGNLSVIIEALDFASRTHRANLEQLLMQCEEAKIEAEPTEDS
jgi:ribonuclease PH